jgi:hypothetical protein
MWMWGSDVEEKLREIANDAVKRIESLRNIKRKNAKKYCTRDLKKKMKGEGETEKDLSRGE